MNPSRPTPLVEERLPAQRNGRHDRLHETAVLHVAVLPSGHTNAIGRHGSLWRQGGFNTPVIKQPQVVSANVSNLCGQRLSASYPHSTITDCVHPDDAEAALLDAIDAGDCDADGEPIPYPKYRSI